MIEGFALEQQVKARAATATSADRVFELAPRRSLTPRGAQALLAIVGITTLSIAGFFSLLGFWPILPFAGLEIALLAWALRVSMRSGLRREFITITADSVTVARHCEHGEDTSVFPRHWVKVKLHAPPTALHPSRLILESHGRALEVGRFLTEDERRSLAVRLKQLVGNVNESPALR